mmetsp:Transcript_125026/g.241124  ORF Transcript_125026/g.241124 Transcript_125026/m.241124 type:complete len:99 (+) Transcript_125026:1-297(+)
MRGMEMEGWQNKLHECEGSVQASEDSQQWNLQIDSGDILPVQGSSTKLEMDLRPLLGTAILQDLEVEDLAAVEIKPGKVEAKSGPSYDCKPYRKIEYS